MNEKRYTLVILLTVTIVILFYIRQSDNSLIQTTNSTSVTSLITKIREIKELRCATYQEELVLTKEKTQNIGDKNMGMVLTDLATQSKLFSNKIVLIIKGLTYASLDLSQLSEKDILIQNDTLFCHLPAFTVSETIINPSDIEIYNQKGDWSQNEINKIIIEAKDQMKQNAINNHLLERAQKNGEMQLSALLQVAGYSAIVFSYK